jgi:hypothetical protein
MVTTIEGSGRTREPGEIFRKPLLDAESLADSGFVLKAEIESTIDKVSLAEAGEFPLCVNMRSTRDPFSIDHPNTSFLIGSDIKIPTIDVSDDGEHMLKVVDDNAAIAVGDPIALAGGGKVDKYVPTTVIDDATTIARFIELGEIVGYATGAAPAGGGGDPGVDKVRVKLTIKLCPMIA